MASQSSTVLACLQITYGFGAASPDVLGPETKMKSQQTLSTDGSMKCLFLIENLMVDTALTLDIVHLLPPRLADCMAP